MTLASWRGGGADVVAARNQERKLDDSRGLVRGRDRGERQRRAVGALHCPLPGWLSRRRRAPRNDPLHRQGSGGARRQVEQAGRRPGNDIHGAGHIDIMGPHAGVEGHSSTRAARPPAGASTRLTASGGSATRRSTPARAKQGAGTTSLAVGASVRRRGPGIGRNNSRGSAVPGPVLPSTLAGPSGRINRR